MESQHCVIERLSRPVGEADVRGLAELLVDAVASGAAVSFLAPLSVEAAADWWRRTLEGADRRAVFLAARDGEGIVGSVQMHPAWAPNQAHRAEVVKLLVHRRARRKGLGRALMEAVEAAARADGFSLLTLDAKRGANAEGLYRQMGWIEVGVIPRYAVDPDGKTMHDTVVMYKQF
jgi:GNAT superfamily N-acetyltransferase